MIKENVGEGAIEKTGCLEDCQQKVWHLLAQLSELDVKIDEWLMPTNLEKAKEQFLEAIRAVQMTHETGSVMISQPSFAYDKLDRMVIKANVAKCQILSEEVVHFNNTANGERKILIWLLKEIHHKWRLLEATSDLLNLRELDNTLSQTTVENRFRRFNAKVYGEPDQETFLRLLNYQLNSLPRINGDEAEWMVRVELSLRLADLEVYDFDQESLIPWSWLEYRPMKSTEEALATLLRVNWPDASSWGEILSPEESLERILPQGVPGYEEFSIGVNSCIDQVLHKQGFSRQVPGIDQYVNIGLAYFGERNFREVFEIRWRMLYLMENQAELTTRERREQAQDKAFMQVAQAFLGTGCLPLGRDLAYYNGAVKVWKCIEGLGGDYRKIMSFLEHGKIDPTNVMHRNILALARRLVREDE